VSFVNVTMHTVGEWMFYFCGLSHVKLIVLQVHSANHYGICNSGVNLCHSVVHIMTDSAVKAEASGESRSATLLGRSCLEHYVHIKQ